MWWLAGYLPEKILPAEITQSVVLSFLLLLLDRKETDKGTCRSQLCDHVQSCRNQKFHSFFNRTEVSCQKVLSCKKENPNTLCG